MVEEKAMGKVVSIADRKEVDILNGKVVTLPESGVDYLFLCKQFLTIEDYEEVLCCILDQEYYNEAEPQIQEIVKSYFSFVSNY
jgi:hypothetical protein